MYTQKQSRAQELFEMLTEELHREALEQAQERLSGMFGALLKPEGSPMAISSVEVRDMIKDMHVDMQDNKVVVKKRVVSPATLRKLKKNLKKARAARAEKALAAKRSTKKVVKKTKKK